MESLGDHSIAEQLMHLGNGAITTECAILGFAGAAAGLGTAWYLSHKDRPSLGKIAALGSFVFAAQMINVPIGSSSLHFVGGVLLAEMLGPAVGMSVMAAVLAIQAIVLGDGGMMALGVNTINMAVLPALIVAGLRRGTLARDYAVALASVLAIVGAVSLVLVETAIGRPAETLNNWQAFAQAMVVNHLLLLPLEALLTVALIKVWQHSEERWKPAFLVGAALSIAALLTVSSTKISSELPDGYESAAESSGWTTLIAEGK